MTSARASETRIFMPPESSRGTASAESARPTARSAASTRARIAARAFAAQHERQFDVAAHAGPGHQRGVLEHVAGRRRRPAGSRTIGRRSARRARSAAAAPCSCRSPRARAGSRTRRPPWRDRCRRGRRRPPGNMAVHAVQAQERAGVAGAAADVVVDMARISAAPSALHRGQPLPRRPVRHAPRSLA